MAGLDTQWKALVKQLKKLDRQTRKMVERTLRQAEPHVRQAMKDAARVGRGLRAGMAAGAAAYRRASTRKRK